MYSGLEVASFGNSNLNILPPGNDNARGLSDTPHTLSLLIFCPFLFLCRACLFLQFNVRGSL